MANEKKISLHLRGDNLKKIKKAAVKENRSTNQLINIAVEEYLKKHEITTSAD